MTEAYSDPQQNSHIDRTDIPDSPKAYFEALEKTVSDALSVDEKYSILRNVFYRSVDRTTAECKVSFNGLFAKVDYQVKECNIPNHIARLIHNTRKILFPQGNNNTKQSSIDLASSFPHDLKATCLLISHIYNADIPQSLKACFPLVDRHSSWGKYDENKLRITVGSCDDEYISGIEQSTQQEVRICYGTDNTYLSRNGKGDWSYLHNILTEGCNINIVRVREADNVLFPELIIYEPDYLVSISSIAECFDGSLRETPYIEMLRKIKEDRPTVPILLGNLAGQFLDDIVHQSALSFEESFNIFVKKNALKIATCSDLSEGLDDFRKSAENQYQNITQLIGHNLPSLIDGFDMNSVILEPSFFSETLGLQGRLDFLYEDATQTIIIEQKSGKGAFVPGAQNSAIPVAQTKHWIQLLLYRALFIYEFQKYAEQLSHIFLLYSKYSGGLLSTAQSPELLLRAIRMRNLIAWMDIRCAQGEFTRLSSITPNTFKAKGTNEKFWNTYKLPELSHILGPIHAASPTEKAYYFRFLRFLATEQLLSKVGNNTRQNPGFAAKWIATLSDKRDSGDIYDNLIINQCDTENDAVSSISLRFAGMQDTDMSNFRIGDIVILYPYHQGDVPNACAQMVHRASITEITSISITLRLRNSQTDACIFNVSDDIRWAIEHDMLDTTYNSLYQGLQRFLTASVERRDMLMCKRGLKVDKSITLNNNYGAFNPLVEGARQARDLFIVIGPPGTGKTSFGMLNILQEELSNPDTNILLLSYTNRAVDEICSKLVDPSLKQPIDFVRIGSDLSCSKEYHKYLLDNKTKDCSSPKEVRDIILSTRVFCGTTSAFNSNISLLTIKRFTLAIVDEASQILEPHLVGLLSAKCGSREAIERIVMIGDHKQLPAVVQQSEEESSVTETELLEIGLSNCRLSLFERFLNQFRMADGNYDPSFVYMLTKQGRMHQEVAAFPNVAFYEGKLQIVGAPILPHQQLVMPSASKSGNGIVDMLTVMPVSFIATPRPYPFISEKVNQVEADMIAATVIQIYHLTKDSFNVQKTVGIIVPYRNQISTVRNAIDRYGINTLHGITIDTVERYQGSQRDYIIYGFTIQRPYQLEFLASNTFTENGQIIDRKLNVAMTRARLHLIMFGNPHLLSENPTFARLMDYAKNHNCYINTHPQSYITGQF